jgi:hypothetical protein
MTSTSAAQSQGSRPQPAAIRAIEDERTGRRQDGRRTRRREPTLHAVIPGVDEEEDAGLFIRLRERKLVEWMLAYFALAWLAVQMTEALGQIWNWPLALQRAITLGLAFGTLPAAVIAWYHGEKGRQKVCIPEMAVLGALLSACALVFWSLWASL